MSTTASTAVTVYMLPSCAQCTPTLRAFCRAGVAYEVVDLSRDAAAMGRVRALGYQRTPVVVAGGEQWSGFRPDLIRALARVLA